MWNDEREEALQSIEEEILTSERQTSHEWDEDEKPMINTKTIYTKLLEFQKKDVAVKRDGQNPHFRSSYVTLNEVLAKVKKPLNDLGIVIIQLPQEQGLKTVLYDTETTTSIEAFMPYVEATTAQKLGSNNTYNRRYSLITLLGLEDDDDDGNASVGLQNAPEATKDPEPIRRATNKQKEFIIKLVKELGKPMPDQTWFDNLSLALAKASIDKLMSEKDEGTPRVEY